MNYTIKIFKNNRMARLSRTHKIRRFLNIIRQINWKHRDIKIYLKVDYGMSLDNYGKLARFYNDGDYNKKKDFCLALRAFNEED